MNPDRPRPRGGAFVGRVTAFAEMTASLAGSSDLGPWHAAVEANDQPELRPLAARIRSDREAVVNVSSAEPGSVCRLAAL
jgi:hypothetical protein